ncbi:MAG TPA: flagellar biosynthetic protein FliR [Anaeromyxobacteraceae bacterium]|nr:flagellar biosynthetic protein FliR [Anaeromyxobacteraceae bacterium]
MEVLAGQGWGYLLVLLRTAGLLVSAPILGARVVPVRIRLSLSVVLALAAFTGAGAPAVALPRGIPGLVLAVAAETALGLLAGFAASWVLQAAVAAGQVIGVSMGIGFASMVDPASGANSNAPGELLLTLAQLSALALGIHREAIGWLARSVRLWPPGGELPVEALASRAIGQAVLGATLAVRVAFPVLAAVLVAYALMGVLSRAAPQLSLASVGFSVAILCGGGALYLVVPHAAEVIARTTVAAFSR